MIHFIHRLTVQSSVVSSQILNDPQGKEIEITVEFEIREVCENTVLINKLNVPSYNRIMSAIQLLDAIFGTLLKGMWSTVT